MRTVRLKKVKQDEIIVLQDAVYRYPASLIRKDIEDLALASDICNRLFLMFRRKIEAGTEKALISLRLSEAVILVRCLRQPDKERGPYEVAICEKHKLEIYIQLHNL